MLSHTRMLIPYPEWMIPLTHFQIQCGFLKGGYQQVEVALKEHEKTAFVPKRAYLNSM